MENRQIPNAQRVGLFFKGFNSEKVRIPSLPHTRSKRRIGGF